MPYHHQPFGTTRPALFARTSNPQPPLSFNNGLPPKIKTSSSSHTMDFFHLKDSKDKRRSVSGSPKLAPYKPAKLDISIESPPLVMYGPMGHSSGALLSGMITLTVNDEQVKLQQFEMRLLAKTTSKRPVSRDCPDCKTKAAELHQWHFLSEPQRYHKGSHAFPFSFLLPGSLPATTQSVIGSVDYVLSAKATTPLGDDLVLETPIKVLRALLSSADRTSLRIFPPTNLTATVITPPVIHPIGEFNVQMRISGVVETDQTHLRRWRIRKMNWRIEEHSKMISAPCPKHVQKVGAEGKGILSQDTRIIGGKEVKEGWKSDFDTQGGLIEMEFPASIKQGTHPICDVEAPTGLSVTHNLIVELIVAEEAYSHKYSKSVTPTGTARVLRMQFTLVVTERSGLGISWDEEQPPMYEDVPSSPPGYAQMTDYEGEPLPYEDLEQLS
ncbi:hypothetical protein MMC19_001579 [Ptychographa xylographoides]|nr:hypothetical protein [Ptychographa xylographoides]